MHRSDKWENLSWFRTLTAEATMVRLSALAAFCMFASAAGSVPADDTATEDPTIPVRAAFNAMCKAKSELEAAKDDDKRRADLAKKSEAARAKFGAAFDKVDWTVWDLGRDSDLLAEGVSTFAAKAEYAEDYARARKGWEFLVERLPQHRMTVLGASHVLPKVYAAAGELDAGIEKISGYASRLPPDDAAFALVGLGDLLAAKGQYEKARRAYSDAEAAHAKSKSADGRAWIEDELAHRKIVGLRAGEIAAPDWVGAKPAPLSAFAGRVVLLWIFRPIGGRVPTAIVKSIDSAQKTLGAKGFAAFGATSFGSVSPLTRMQETVDTKLPRGPDDEDGEPVKVSRATFHKYLESYRQRMRVSFPLAIADEKSLDEFAPGALNGGLFVIGTDQVVAYSGDSFDWRAAKGIAAAVCARSAAAPVPSDK